MKKQQSSDTNVTRESGFALLLALIFLLILTTLGITVMGSSTLEYRMGANAAFHEQAFQGGEAGRRAVSSTLPEHVFERGWDGVTKPTGMIIKDRNNNNTPDNFYVIGAAGAEENEDLQDSSTLLEDATYSQGAIEASIAVVDVATLVNSGTGQEMFRGYDGLGQSSAVGGTVRIFEVRSKGEGDGNASATLASHYRVILR